jgi:hypothetical protein
MNGSEKTMGVEDFRVRLSGALDKSISVIDHLLRIPGMRRDEELQSIDGCYLMFRDDGHLIELEVDETEISCRFALCHAPTVDSIFARLLRQIATPLRWKISILDHLPPDVPWDFYPPAYEGLEGALSIAIASRRDEWKRLFGSVEAGVSTSEAIDRFILPLCDPPPAPPR